LLFTVFLIVFILHLHFITLNHLMHILFPRHLFLIAIIFSVYLGLDVI